MKITDLEVIRMQANAEPHNNWLFVRIHTDSGITGIGEGSLQYKDVALTAELENFGAYLRGKDPFQIEHIWLNYELSRRYGTLVTHNTRHFNRIADLKLYQMR